MFANWLYPKEKSTFSYGQDIVLDIRKALQAQSLQNLICLFYQPSLPPVFSTVVANGINIHPEPKPETTLDSNHSKLLPSPQPPYPCPLTKTAFTFPSLDKTLERLLDSRP